MLKNAPSRSGSALLIILAFVLLLTIITTAFLSKSLQEKTVSNASSDQTRTDVFAAGAIDAILSDCQQEIAAGSTISTNTYTSSTGTTTVAIYTPSSAQTIVPSRTWQFAAITQPNPLPNLLKRSACALAFYPTGSMNGAANYPNASSYPVSESTFTAADPNDSTSVPSLNGRFYSAARWNKPLLLPPPTGTYTSSSYTNLTPSSGFTVPDWILVQRDGANPTAWSNTLTVPAPDDVTTTNKNPVVGRYAYMIYDEGGLLDMNVTGYPSTAGTSSSPQHFYRTSLATVDLMQLLPSAGATAFFPNTGATKTPVNATIDAIVGWRNYATLPASGTIPSYTLPSNSVATNYFLNVQPPGSGGFMHTTVPYLGSVSVTNGTDRKFSSRQQLIDLMMNDIAQGNSTTQANMESALQYLGTFSRDLNQPSYQPDANRPRMAAGTATDPASSGGNAAAPDDASNYINVGFPTTMVQTAFTRSDGSAANVGDPVVKRRFALNRLAWLTFAGPIADDNGNLNPTGNSNLATIITQLETGYGYTAAFLSQGGPTNIQKYFGLSWATDTNDTPPAGGRSKWFYNIHNNSSGTAGQGIIRELGGPNGIAATGDANPHDPDFFELLKAAILAGSKGRTLTTVTGVQKFSSDVLHPYLLQTLSDSSLDYQVLQIGANIIDQSRLDGFATEIVFNNGNGPIEVRGVENYPYLYRVRTGALCLRHTSAQVTDNTTVANSGSFTDPGVAALMQIPEIWNPHDVNAPMVNPSVSTTTFYPTQFRLVVDSTSPANLDPNPNQINSTFYSQISAYGQDSAEKPSASQSNTTGQPQTPVFSTTPGGTTAITDGPTPSAGGYQGYPQAFTPANTALTFSGAALITYPGMFREPTQLARPNVPAGSNLAMAPGWAGTTNWASIQNATGNCYQSGGLLPDPGQTNPLNLPTAPTGTTTPYIGILLGLYPIQYLDGSSNIRVSTRGQLGNSGSLNSYLTYRMQYMDSAGQWATYDEKYVWPAISYPVTPGTSGAQQGMLNNNNTSATSTPGYYQSGCFQSFADPRTSRFGAPDSVNNSFLYLATPGSFNTAEFLDGVNGVLISDRPDHNQGFMIESNNNGAWLNSAAAPGWSFNATGNQYFRWGPVSQNTISSTQQGTALRYINDKAGNPASYYSYYYSDSDGVVRRAMGGEVPNYATATPPNLFGYPMATATPTTKATAANGAIGYAAAQATQSGSRPYMLKRPFFSVAELGCVFSGTPWKNLDFSNPESGDSPLLDVFCINDTDDPNALVAGKVNLNTQQVPVLAAILAEAYYDDLNQKNATSGGYIGATGPAPGAGTSGSGYANAAFSLANILVNGPSGTTGTSVTPLMNVRELVGKFVGSAQAAGTMGIDGTSPSYYGISASDPGFSSNIGSFYNPSTGAGASYYNAYQTRFREAALRALSAVGETRVWNLMIDVVAQTGRYPSTATNASNFVVEGERRYWVHVAIDRYTGKILDRQIEEVRQ